MFPTFARCTFLKGPGTQGHRQCSIHLWGPMPPAWGWPFPLGAMPVQFWRSSLQTTQGDRKHPQWLRCSLHGAEAQNQNLSRLQKRETPLWPETQEHLIQQLILSNSPQSNSLGFKVTTSITSSLGVATSYPYLNSPLSFLASCLGHSPSSVLREFEVFQTYPKKQAEFMADSLVSSPPCDACLSLHVCIPQLLFLVWTCPGLCLKLKPPRKQELVHWVCKHFSKWF